MAYLIPFLFGLAIGSFLNVLSFRYDPRGSLLDKKVIGGRSHCQNCGKTLKWHELIPVLSFLWLRGRCGSCHIKLSLQYPIVEILGGASVALPFFYFFSYRHIDYLNFGTTLYFYSALWALILLDLLLIGVIDYREYLVPDELVYFLFAAAAAWMLLLFISGNFGFASGSFLNAYAGLFGLRDNLFINHLFGALAGFLSVAILYFISRGRAIGFGDAKLFSALGLLLGWPDVILTLGISFIIGAVFSLVLIARGEKNMKDFVPFAPFVVTAAFLVFFFGYDIMKMYFSFFSF